MPTDYDALARVNALRREVSAIRRELSSEDVEALAMTQARADAALAPFGKRSSPPISGEMPDKYRQRMLRHLAPLSPRFKDETFYSVTGAALTVCEDQVYADAMAAARDSDSPANAGRLIPLQERDDAGRLVTKFAGDPLSWMQSFMSAGRRGHIPNPNRRLGS
jgi:hypothetical protein